MKYLRLVMFYILMLAIPTSNFASVIVASHCQTSNSPQHSIQMQIDENESMHMHNEDHKAHQDTSVHDDCKCDCNVEINCTVSGSSAAALITAFGLAPINLSSSMYTNLVVFTAPPDPDLLLRPPTSLT